MEVRMIDIDRIVEDPNQPRRALDDEALSGLADSIRRHGLIQPITVVALHNVGMYRIVTGERRWRAAQLAGMPHVPCIVQELSDEDVLAQQMIENMQREDLKPLEKARAVAALQDRTGSTSREVAGMLGLSERSVGSLLDLLELPADIGESVVSSPNRPADGRLTEKHARYIRQLTDQPEVQRRVAARVQDDRLTSADTASLVRALRESPEYSEEILTAPPEAFSGYLKAKDRAAAQRQAERSDDAITASTGGAAVREMIAALDQVRPIEMTPAQITDAQEALTSLKIAIDALLRECELELAAR